MIRTGLIFTGLLFLIACGFSAYGWLNVPEGAQIPVHFNIQGEADRYGGKAEAFLFMPALILGLGLLLAVLPKIDPRGRNLANSRAPYLVSWIGALAIVCGVQALLVWTTLGGGGDTAPPLVMRGVLAVSAVFFIVIGNFIGKARPNFFLGVRTPWTLTSDIAWEKTHRLTGKLWMAAGALALLASLFAPVMAALAVFLAATLGVAVFAIAYSYVVWRSAPDKRQGPQAVE